MVFPPQRQFPNAMRSNNFMFPRQGFQQMPTRGNPIGRLLQRFLGSGSNQNVGFTGTRGLGGLGGPGGLRGLGGLGGPGGGGLGGLGGLGGPAGGGLGSSGGGVVGGLSNTLNNVQQILRVVDTTAPIVKQYGPLVKNLPAMYRMMKAFKNLESTNSSKESSKDESNERNESYDRDESYERIESYDRDESYKRMESESLDLLSSSSLSYDESPIKRNRAGRSTPKLYI